MTIHHESPRHTSTGDFDSTEMQIQMNTEMRRELRDEALRESSNLTPELIASLGERGYALANNEYTYPAQAEALMADLAAITQDPSILKLAHSTIETQFAPQPEHVRTTNHANLEEHVRLVASGTPIEHAAHIALDNVFQTLHGMNMEDALRRSSSLKESAERYSPEKALSKNDVYSICAQALGAFERSRDQLGRELAANSVKEAASLLIAQVTPPEFQQHLSLLEINEPVVPSAPDTLDLYLVGDAVNIIKEVAGKDDEVIIPLKKAVERIAAELDKSEVRRVVVALESVSNKSITRKEAVQNLITPIHDLAA